jgi:1-phosphatidylinositol-4-phosphate 5-kinase
MGEKSCVFKDYAPNLFAKIRETCNINPEVYLASIGPSKLVSSLLGGDTSTLSELMSPGKSGSFLYFTYDGSKH